MRKLQRTLNAARILTKLLHIRKAGVAGVGESLVRIESTNAGAVAQDLELYRNSASPAASDDLFSLAFYGKDSAGNKTLYADIMARILDPTNTTEDAVMLFDTLIAGAYATRIRLGAGLYTEGVTGGDKGAGTINAEELYMAGSLVPFSKEFISSGQTITSGGALALPHGLGVAPKLIAYHLVCGTAEHGYSIGDVSHPLQDGEGGFGGCGLACTPTSSDLNVIYGSNATPLTTRHKTAGTIVNLTNARWTVVFKAWA